MWCLLRLAIVLQCVNSVRIVNMRVPEVIQYGTKDKITMDCDYIISNVTGLVVKWFYMDKFHQVYQWIPPHKPQALGILRNKVDLTYKVSRNPYTQHRALRISSPEPELTGNYTCVVSTFLAEDEKTKPMTIFVPEKKFDMVADRLNEEFLDIICIVEGVFPKPELVILAGNRILNAKSSIHLVDGRYKASTSAVVRVDALPPTVEILCDMQVPLANYYSRKRDVFYRDPPPSTPKIPNSAHSTHKGHHCLPLTVVPTVMLLQIIFKVT